MIRQQTSHAGLQPVGEILAEAFPPLGSHLVVLALQGARVDPALVAHQPARIQHLVLSIAGLRATERAELKRRLMEHTRHEPCFCASAGKPPW